MFRAKRIAEKTGLIRNGLATFYDLSFSSAPFSTSRRLFILPGKPVFSQILLLCTSLRSNLMLSQTVSEDWSDISMPTNAELSLVLIVLVPEILAVELSYV